MSGRTEKSLIAGIIGLAFILRFWGISFGLPGLYHADEPIVLNHALAYGAGDLNPHFFKIPPLVSYLLFGVFGLYYLLGWLAGLFSDISSFETLFYNDPTSFYFLARLCFGAIAGTLTVFVFYKIVRRHFGPLTGLLCAFFLSVCFLHVSDSHYLYADIPLLLAIVCAMGFIWKISSNSTLWNHATAGALIGLAAAFKYNGVFMGVPYAVMLLGSPGTGTMKILRGFTAAMSAALLFFILNPFAVFDSSFFWSELRAQAGAQGGVGWLHHGIYSLPGAVGVPVLLAAIGGFFLLGTGHQNHEQRLKKGALLIFLLVYYAVLAKAGQPYPRYVLPLIPGVIFFASDLMAKGFEQRRFGWFMGLGVIALSVFPFMKSVLWCHLMSSEDTRTQAKVWIEQNLPQGSVIALDWDFYTPRLNFSKPQLEFKKNSLKSDAEFNGIKSNRLDALIQKTENEPSFELHFLVPNAGSQERYLMASPVAAYDIKALKSKAVQYAVVLPGIPQKSASQFYEELKESAALVKTFSPYVDESLSPSDNVTMTGGPFTWSEIVRRRGNGHALQIYRLTAEVL